MSKALELAKFGRETPPTGVVVGDTDAQTLSSKTFSDMPVFSSGTANTVAYLNASKVLSSSTSLSFDGSNLGIGVASPAATLDVYGGASGRLQIYSSASGNFLTSKVAANTGYQILNYLGSQHVWGDGTNTEMTLDASGNLGVGTITPSSALYVKRTSGNSGIYTDYNGTNVGRIEAASNGNLYIGLTTGSGDIAIGNTANTSVINILSSGNVGIGTASPSTKLEVAGAAKLTGTNLAIVPSSTGASAYLVNTNASGNFFFGIDNNTGASFGVGAYGRVLYSSAAYPMAFFTNDLERMRINSAGNVGIGTNSPAYKLDVQGGNSRLQTENSVTQFATFAYSSTQSYHDGRWTAWRARGTAASPLVVAAGDELSAWEISGFNGSAGWTYAAGIRVYATGTISGTTVPTYMTFETNSGATATERMRIDSAGVVSISSTNPTLTFTRTNNGTTPAAAINFSATSTVKWQIATNQAIGPGLEFNAGDATSNKMYLTTAGNLLVGGTTSYGGTMTLLPVGGNPTSATSSLNQLHIGEASQNINYSLKLGYTFIGGGYQGNIQAIAGGAAGPLLLNAAGGNVGIGTTAPGYILDVQNYAALNTIARFYNGYATGNTDIYVNNAGTGGDLLLTRRAAGDFWIYQSGAFPVSIYTQATKRFTVDASGRIGFASTGTSADRFIDASFAGATLSAGSTNFGLVLNPTYGTGVTTNLFNLYTGPNLTPGTTCTNVFNLYLETMNTTGSTVSNKYALYQASGSEKNYFAGSVGIGTTAPNEKLTVWTTSATGLQTALRLNNPFGFANQNTGTQIVFSQDRSTAEDLKQGIIAVGQQDAGTSATSYMSFYTNNTGLTERMRITSTGNVGIGTNNPAHKLDVTGTINASGGILANAENFEKYLGVKSFPDGVANRAINVQFGNLALGGRIEITIAGTFSNGNAGGGLTKVFSVLTNPNNAIYTSESRVTTIVGPIVTHFAIGEFQWDSGSSQYIIPISHIASSGNPVYVHIKVYGMSNTANIYNNVSLSEPYTLTALSRNYEHYNGRLGIGKTNPSVALDVVGNAQVTTTAAGTYGLIAVGSSGGARDIFLAGQAGFSNGFTVRYDGAAMGYAFQDGNVCIGAITPFGNLGVAGSTNLGNNVASSQAAQYFTRLSGYAARYDASNRYGSYGQLIFHSDDGWTGGARRWMLTNVLNATSFGIIRSATALTDPTLGDAGSVSSGTVDFAISNTGNVSIGTTANQSYWSSSVIPKLEVKGATNLGPASSGVVSSTATNGGSLFRQTTWSGATTSITLGYDDIGAIDNSGGMLTVTASNKLGGANGGVGTILIIWTKHSGGNLACTTVSSLVSGATTTMTAAASGNTLVITSNSNSYFAWTSISAG